tara:strand:- start:1759 stop:2016 length:258 start_codon:yes stop_codon:yes gene_type:complete
MINILENFFTKIIPGVESFTQEGNSSKLQNTLPLILAVAVTEILLLLIGKFIWNTHLVNAVTIVRPINSVIQLFAISILLRLLLG